MLSRRRDVQGSPLAAAAGRMGPAPWLALLTAVLALALLRLGLLPGTAQGEDPSLGPDRPPALMGLYGGEVTALHRAGQRLYAGIGGQANIRRKEAGRLAHKKVLKMRHFGYHPDQSAGAGRLIVARVRSSDRRRRPPVVRGRRSVEEGQEQALR